MRVYLNRAFQRFAQKEGISDGSICDAVERLERGILDADLGGNVVKQRIPRLNKGRSGGYRTIVVYKAGNKAFFVHGFAKNDKGNIDKRELRDIRDLGQILLGLDQMSLDSLVRRNELLEVKYDK